MSIHRLAQGNGIFSPEDLTLLQEVLDQTCARNGEKGEEARATVGRKIIILFQGGARDGDLLIAALTGGQSTPPRGQIVWAISRPSPAMDYTGVDYRAGDRGRDYLAGVRLK